MITFHVSGMLPRALTKSMFPRIARACSGVRGLGGRRNLEIGIRFASPREIQRLNMTYRGKNCPTDVLSFSSEEGNFPEGRGTGKIRELGDLVVCPAVAIREAKRRLINPKEELVRLIVHGTLHLAGFDHATEKEEAIMFGIQEQIIEKSVV